MSHHEPCRRELYQMMLRLDMDIRQHYERVQFLKCDHNAFYTIGLLFCNKCSEKCYKCSDVCEYCANYIDSNAIEFVLSKIVETNNWDILELTPNLYNYCKDLSNYEYDLEQENFHSLNRLLGKLFRE
jgi:hypothetical protein